MYCEYNILYNIPYNNGASLFLRFKSISLPAGHKRKGRAGDFKMEAGAEDTWQGGLLYDLDKRTNTNTDS